MDDYRDIGANDFERYEKIRKRFSDIVRDFDLVTNSTPGTLMLDPVHVVYDLATSARPLPELAPETETFKREVLNVQKTFASGSGDTTTTFTDVLGPFSNANNRIERILGFDLEINANATTSTGIQINWLVRDPILGNDLRHFIAENTDNDLQSWVYLTEGTGISAKQWQRIPFENITVGAQQSIILDVNVIGAATLDGDVIVTYNVLYEYQET